MDSYIFHIQRKRRVRTNGQLNYTSCVNVLPHTSTAPPEDQVLDQAASF